MKSVYQGIKSSLASVGIWRAYGALFPIVSSCISIFLLVWTVQYDNPLTLALLTLTFFSVALTILLLTAWFILGQKARYPEANQDIHMAVHYCRDLFRYLEWCSDTSSPKCFDRKQVKQTLEKVLTKVASAFTIARGVRCRACIKLLGHVDGGGANPTDELERLYVVTLARDDQSAERRRDSDVKENRAKRHIVSENTDFSNITRLMSSYYLNGNIQRDQSYQTSSSIYKHGPSSNDTVYRSVLTVPIRYIYTDGDEHALVSTEAYDKISNRYNQELLGFLCIDANARQAFEPKYDVELANCFADALFPVFEAYRKCRHVAERSQSQQSEQQCP